MTIYAGSTRRWIGTQIRNVSRLIIHSGYSPTTFINDIALLELASRLLTNDPYLNIICLPSVNSTIQSTGE